MTFDKLRRPQLSDEGYDSGIGDSLPDGTDDNQSISDKEDSLNWLRVFIDNTPCRQHLRLNSQDLLRGEAVSFMMTESFKDVKNASEMLHEHFFVNLNGAAGTGKSITGQNLGKTFLKEMLDRKVVYPESVCKYIAYINAYDESVSPLVILDDIFKDYETEVDMGHAFEWTLKKINEDTDTYSIITSQPNEFECSFHELGLSDLVKCLLETFVTNIDTNQQELLDIFTSKYSLKYQSKWQCSVVTDYFDEIRQVNASKHLLIMPMVLEMMNELEDQTDVYIYDHVNMTDSWKSLNKRFSREIMLQENMLSERISTLEQGQRYELNCSVSTWCDLLEQGHHSNQNEEMNGCAFSTNLYGRCHERYSLIQFLVMAQTFDSELMPSNFEKLALRSPMARAGRSGILLHPPDDSRYLQHNLYIHLNSITFNGISICGGAMVTHEKSEKDKKQEPDTDRNQKLSAPTHCMIKQITAKEMEVVPVEHEEDRVLFLIPNFDRLTENDEDTPDDEKGLAGKVFLDDGEYHNTENKKQTSIEVSGNNDTSAMLVHTALEAEGKYREIYCLDPKVPESEVELKESDETENNEKCGEIAAVSIEDTVKHAGLIAQSGNKFENNWPKETNHMIEKGAMENKVKSDLQTFSENLNNDNDPKATLYDKEKSLTVLNPDTLEHNRDIVIARKDMNNQENNQEKNHSGLQEQTFERDKDKPSFTERSESKHWPTIGENVVTDLYCGPSEKSLTKHAKDQLNYQIKGMCTPFTQSTHTIEETQSSCRSCEAECLNCQSVFEGMFDKMMNQQMAKMTASLRREWDKTSGEIQHALESLRKRSLVGKLNKASATGRGSGSSNSAAGDENNLHLSSHNLHLSSHVKIDYDTLLDQKSEVDLEEYGSDTQVKQTYENTNIHSMHPLKFQNMQEDQYHGGEHCFGTVMRNLSYSEADENSLYPDTLSCSQGRSNVSFDEMIGESIDTASNVIPSEDEYEKNPDNILDNSSNENAVRNTTPQHEEYCIDDGIFCSNTVEEVIDVELSDDDIYSSNEKEIDMSPKKSALEQTSTGINTTSNSSSELVDTFEYHDPVETMMSNKDVLKEENQYIRGENEVEDSGADVNIDFENIAENFSEEVMKEFEKYIENHITLKISTSRLLGGNDVKDNAGKDRISVLEEGVSLEHETSNEELEISANAAASILGEQGLEQCQASGESTLSDEDCIEEQLDTMPLDQNSQDSSVESLSTYKFSSHCMPYEEPDCIPYKESDSDDESHISVVPRNKHPRQRIGKTRRISRPRAVAIKPSDQRRQARVLSGKRKGSRKMRQTGEENIYVYQSNMPSDVSFPFSVNGRVNKTRPREKKRIKQKYGNRILLHLDVFNLTEKSTNQRKVRQELYNDQTHKQIQYRVVEDVDSGIYSSIMSVRSSILKEHDSYTKSLSSKGKERRKRYRKSNRELNRLDSELHSFLRSLERTVERHVTNDGVVFGLERYFESLNNGQTPSLQEQMRYEWLRLMSFSNYTGGGSPVHLARNGFYHSGNNETRCICCNTSHSSWTYSDNVQETHRRISPNCPLVTGGIEINENISIESGSRGNQPLHRPANLGNGSGSAGTGQGGSQSGVYSAARPDLPTSHGGFASNAPQGPTFGFPPASTATGISASPFSFNPPQPAVPRPDPSEFRFPQTSSHVPPDVLSHVGQSAATVTSNAATEFSFGSSVNAPPPPAEFTFAQGTGQQRGGSDITSQLRALTLQQSIAQQPSDEPISGNPVIAPTQPLQIARHTGEDQLSISAQQPPETHDLPQNPARNQRTPGNESSGSAPPAQQTENADNIEITQLKHPRYRTMDVRMSSFRSWPNYLNQTPRQMAYAGFFHPGVADFARCFCCGGGLRNWEADDDPMVEHARWYPRCEYINRLKGSHFVQAVLRRHREHMAERQREQEVPQNTFLTPDPMSTSVAANLLEMGFTQERAREAILTVRRLRGRAEVSIEEVTAWMLDDGTTQNQGPPDRGTTVNPRDTVGNAPPQPGRPQTPASSGSGSFESAATSRHDSDGHSSVEDGGQRQDRTRGSTEGATGGSKKGDKPPKSKSSKEDSSSDEKPKSSKQDSSDDDEKSKKEKEKSSKEDQSSDEKSKSDKGSDQKKGKSKKDKKTKSRKGSRSPAPGSGEGATGASADVDTKSLKEENKLLKQMQVCKICMDKYVSITFLPCGHLVCCEDCAKSMRKCPICRKRIKGQVRTYMS